MLKKIIQGCVVLVATCAMAGLASATPAAANVVAQVGNSSALVSTNWNNNSLEYYWQTIGGSTWNPQQVAGADTTYSFPAIAEVGGSPVIAAQGPDNSLKFYWHGGSTWNPEQVAGAGTTEGTPSIAQVGNSAVIAALNPDGNIDFYWQAIGSPTWSPPQTVAPADGPYGSPTVTQVGNSSVITAQGPNFTLWYFWQAIGSTTWTPEEVAGAHTTYGKPSIAQIGNSAVIAAASETALYSYSQPIGSPTWSAPQYVGTTYSDTANPSIAQVANMTVIAAYLSRVQNNEVSASLWSYSRATSSTGSYAPGQVTSWSGFNGGSDPSIAQIGNSSVIGISLSNGTGDYYWEANGTTSWHPESVS